MEAAARDVLRQSKDAKPEADAIRDFIRFFEECCLKKPDLFVASENPVRDIAFIDCEFSIPKISFCAYLHVSTFHYVCI
jgi:hypothetical protein